MSFGAAIGYLVTVERLASMTCGSSQLCGLHAVRKTDDDAVVDGVVKELAVMGSSLAAFGTILIVL